MLGRGTAWLDTVTLGSLLAAANFVETIEERQGLNICCAEAIAYRMGYVSPGDLEDLANSLAGRVYGSYPMKVLRNG